MKFERINENQIRCTLTNEDLLSRNLKVSELAYGTAKAKQLFHDMMQEARYELGFDSGTSPLMIEAIPTSAGSITLVITKVDDPEELDARFSRFTQPAEEDMEEERASIGADEILDLFHKIYDSLPSSDNEQKSVSEMPETPQKAADPSEAVSRTNPSRARSVIYSFLFPELDDVIAAAKALPKSFTGKNILYRNMRGEGYRLILHQSSMTPDSFNKICNVLSEYGIGESCTPASDAYYREHGFAVIKSNAVQKLQMM